MIHSLEEKTTTTTTHKRFYVNCSSNHRHSPPKAKEKKSSSLSRIWYPLQRPPRIPIVCMHANDSLEGRLVWIKLRKSKNKARTRTHTRTPDNEPNGIILTVLVYFLHLDFCRSEKKIVSPEFGRRWMLFRATSRKKKNVKYSTSISFYSLLSLLLSSVKTVHRKIVIKKKLDKNLTSDHLCVNLFRIIFVGWKKNIHREGSFFYSLKLA